MVLAGVLAACSSNGSAANVTAAPTSAAPTSRLTDTACNEVAGLPPTKCYFLEVPERRDRADTKTIKLFVAVITPTDVASDARPLVFLEGGPGDPGTAVLNDPPTFVGHPRTLVFVDQRGTGRSEPRLDCKALDQDTTNSTQPWAQRVATAQSEAKGCRDALVAAGVDLDAYPEGPGLRQVACVRRQLRRASRAAGAEARW